MQLSLDARSHAVAIASMARTVGNTGVEMEALTAAAVAALTVYDMCKVCGAECVLQGTVNLFTISNLDCAQAVLLRALVVMRSHSVL